MEQVLYEPVKLTGFELDAVAGGNPFSNQVITIAGSPGVLSVSTQSFSIVSTPSTTSVSGVDNSVNIIFFEVM